jgi:hypothetical protein
MSDPIADLIAQGQRAPRKYQLTGFIDDLLSSYYLDHEYQGEDTQPVTSKPDWIGNRVNNTGHGRNER